MAGLYFKIEGSDFTLAGYFRLRGEVEALGIVSVSIELYLEMRYESASEQVRRHRHAQHRDRRRAVQHHDRDQLHQEVRRLGRGPDPGRDAFDVQPERDLGARGTSTAGRSLMTVRAASSGRPCLNGMTDDERLRLSVHVAPRLRNDDGSDTERKLGEFPTFEHWADAPQRAALRGRLRRRPLGGGDAGGATPTRRSGRASSRLRCGSARTSFQDHAKRDLHAMPVRPLLHVPASGVRRGRRERDRATVARRPARAAGAVPAAGRHPQPGHRLELVLWRAGPRSCRLDKVDGPVVTRPDGQVGLSTPCGAGRRQRLLPRLPLLPPPGQPASRPARRLHRAARRSRTTSSSTRSSQGCADFPELLRRLGIVIDLVVDLDAGAVPATGVVRVVPERRLASRAAAELSWNAVRPRPALVRGPPAERVPA